MRGGSGADGSFASMVFLGRPFHTGDEYKAKMSSLVSIQLCSGNAHKTRNSK